MKRLFIITGEYSGDQHASYVVRELRSIMPDVAIEAIGGEALKKEGIKLFCDHSKMNVVGLDFKAIWEHICLGKNLLRYLKKEFKPNAVLLVDYGGFNLRMAKELHRMGIPCYYYICPQLWVTRRYRIKTIKKYVKKVFLTLPFEKEIYEKEGIPCEYVGHPLVSQLPERYEREKFIEENNLDRNKKIVGIFPGSRKFELENLMDTFLKSVEILEKKSDNIQFCLAQAPTISDELLNKYLKNNPNIKVLKNKNYELLSCADTLMLASGTVALEAALYQTPMIISYRAPWLFYAVYLLIRYIKLVSLPNIILGREVVPELIQHKANPELIAKNIYDLTFDENTRNKMKDALCEMREKLEDRVSSKQVAASLRENLYKDNINKSYFDNLYINFISFFALIYFYFLDLFTRKRIVNYRKFNKPVIYAIWHGLQNSVGCFTKEDRANINILISPSNDGEIANRICRMINFKTIRGSHKRRGSQALREIIRALKNGESVIYTVDGPKGPAYKVKNGILKIAQLSGATVVPISAQMNPIVRFNSWDKYELLTFFTGMTLVMGNEIEIPHDCSEEEGEKYRIQIEDELYRLKEIARKEFKW